MKKLCVLSLLFAGLYCYAQDTAKSLLWQINGAGLKGPSYLFGTIHQVCKDELLINDSLKDIVRKTELLVLEADPDEIGPLKLLKMIRLPKDTLLSDLMSDEDYAVTERFFEDSLGMSLSMFKGYRPFFLISLVGTKYMACEVKDITSYEQELGKIAKKSKIKTRELEGMEKQMEIIAGISLQDQSDELVEYVRNFKKYRKDFHHLNNAYLLQNLEEIESLTEETLTEGSFGTMDVLLVNRNKSWINDMENWMKQEPVFFAVGAAHLPGNDGLLVLLRKRGYKVTPVFFR